MCQPGSASALPARAIRACDALVTSRAALPLPTTRPHLVAALAFGALLAPSAAAQSNASGEGAGPPPTASDDTPAVDLGETTVEAERQDPRDLKVETNVTATGTPAETGDLPVILTTIPERVIEDQQAFRLEDIFRNSPNVQQSPTKGNTQSIHVPFIRGFQTGGVYRNGLFVHQNGVNLNTANIERVEVLKGPQSVLYGLMQPGGVVNYVTKAPTTERIVEYDTIFDQWGRREDRVDLGGALNEDGSLRYRFNAAIYDTDLFTDNEFAEGTFIAPELAWDISDRTTWTFSASYIDEQRLEQGVTGFKQSDGELAFDPETFIGAVGLPGKDQQEGNFFTTLTHQVEDGPRLRFHGGYHDYSLDQLESFAGLFGGVPASGLVDIGVQRVQQDGDDWIGRADALWEFGSDAVQHAVTFGVDYNHHDQERRQATDGDFYGQVDVFDPVLPFGPATPFEPADFPRSRQTRDWFGVFLQDHLSLADDRVHVLANVRWDTVDQESTNFSGAESGIETDDFTSRLGVLWNATDTVSPYVSWSESFVPTSATTVAGDLLDPLEGTQYEGGLKFSLLDDRLGVTTSVFRIDQNNVPIDDPTTADPGSINGGLFRSEGFEIEAVGRLTDGLQVLAGYGQLDATVEESDSLDPGDRLQGVPERSANLWLTYDWEQGALDGLGLGVGAYYRSDIVTQFSQFVGTVVQDSYVTADLSAWYRRPIVEGVDLRLRLTVRNLFDETYSVGGFGNTVQAGQPRTFIGSVGLSFGI